MFKKFYLSLVALLGLCGAVAVGNYNMTQGAGTAFGSIVIGGTVHYAQQLICDYVTPSQCANVSAGGAISTADAAVLAAVNSPIPAQTGIGNVNIGAVQSAGSFYETVAASQTGQVLGATGGTGDYLSHCVIYPTSTTPGVVTVFDNTNAAGTNVIAFPGGASSVTNLAPIAIPVGAISTSGAWKVTTGANLVVTCYGKFT